MAVDVYIQEAAKRLRDAAGALRDDIHATQSEAYRAGVQLHNEIAQAEVAHAEIHAELRLEPDNRRRAALEARLHQLEAEIRDKKAQFSKNDSDAARTVQQKNDLIANIESFIGRLESLAISSR
ncbi:MAG TPA: hypothetical protein VFT53_04030 [Candidatus Saccharimonadales bacterium]|nr:hypothetical protein [Candidatus Saccharimonadales bacterium]